MIVLVRCWFINSEDWIDKVIGSMEILKQRIPTNTPNPLSEEWMLTGFSDTMCLVIHRLRECQEYDYDIAFEIVGKEV